MVNTTTASAVPMGFTNGPTHSASAANALGGVSVTGSGAAAAGAASLSSSLIASAALPRAPSSGARNARLLADVLAVLGQLGGERKRLARGDVADAADQRAGDRDGDECRRNAPQPPVLEAALPPARAGTKRGWRARAG